MSNEKRVVHVFYGSFQHLNPMIIKSIEELSQSSHYYIIYLTKKGRYHLSEKNNEGRYEFYHRVLTSMNVNYFLTGSFLKILFLLVKQRSPFIMHGGNLKRNIGFSSLLFWLPSAWVCWGSFPKFSVTKTQLIGNTKNIIKKISLNSFSQVICLMKPDSEKLRLLYTREAVRTMPYAISKLFDDLYAENRLIGSEIKNRILVGNSGSYVKDYIKVLNDLEKFDSFIHVTCMVNYALKKNHEYSFLKEKGVAFFRDRFIADERFYSRTEYANYIHSFGIYICNVEQQTGLGIIDYCLRSGLKIFLTGNNYQWIISKGYIVYNYDDLKKINLEEFLRPLSYEEKLFNFNNYLRLRDDQANDWNSFYNDFIQSRI